MIDRRSWTRLKATVETIFDPKLDMRLHYSNFSGARYWITLGDKVVWTAPDDYFEEDNPHFAHGISRKWYYWQDQWRYSQDAVMRAYIDTPRAQLMDFPGTHRNDIYHLGGVLLAADRRIGFRRLAYWALMLDETGHAARKILKARFGDSA